MNIFGVIGLVGPLSGILGGLAVYAASQIKGTKAGQETAQKVAALEGKLNGIASDAQAAVAVANTAKNLSEGHALQLPTLNQDIGAAKATAQAALNTITTGALPAGIQDAAKQVVAAEVETGRQQIENMVTAAIQTVSKTPFDVHVTKGVTVGEMAQPTPLGQGGGQTT